MGYTTDFSGAVMITPPLNEDEISFLKDFNETRRMNRRNGPLYIDPNGNYGQTHMPDIIDYNSQHPDQPGLWCQWTPNDDGTAITWDGGEKFYNAPEWMEYIVQLLSNRAYIQQHIGEDARLDNFTCNHVLEGEIDAEGESSGDVWKLVVRDNEVFVKHGRVVFD